MEVNLTKRVRDYDVGFPLVLAGLMFLAGCSHSFEPGAGAYKPGESVPAVNPADLRAVYDMWVDRKGAASPEEYRSACKSECDISAVMDRLSVISLLELLKEQKVLKKPLPRQKNGRVTDAVIQDAATIPLDGTGVGIVRQGAPFDVDKFFHRLSSH